MKNAIAIRFPISTIADMIYPCSLDVNGSNRLCCVNLLGKATAGHASGKAGRVCIHEVITMLERDVMLASCGGAAGIMLTLRKVSLWHGGHISL